MQTNTPYLFGHKHVLLKKEEEGVRQTHETTNVLKHPINFSMFLDLEKIKYCERFTSCAVFGHDLVMKFNLVPFLEFDPILKTYLVKLKEEFMSYDIKKFRAIC